MQFKYFYPIGVLWSKNFRTAVVRWMELHILVWEIYLSEKPMWQDEKENVLHVVYIHDFCIQIESPIE